MREGKGRLVLKLNAQSTMVAMDIRAGERGSARERERESIYWFSYSRQVVKENLSLVSVSRKKKEKNKKKMVIVISFNILFFKDHCLIHLYID